MPHYFILKMNTCCLTFAEKDYVIFKLVIAGRRNVINVPQTRERWTMKVENKDGCGLTPDT